MTNTARLKQATLYGFLAWCKKSGHYPGEKLVKNYMKMLKAKELKDE